jgi:hypothetical protein
MGITISDSIKECLSDFDKLGIEYMINIDKDNIDGIINYLKLLEPDFVMVSDRYRQDREFVLHLANLLKANRINHKLASKSIISNMAIDFKQYQFPVLLNLGSITLDSSKYSAKIICMVNNTPIKVS